MLNNTQPIGRLLATIVLALLVASCASPPEPVKDSGPLMFPKPPDPPRFVFERAFLGTGSARRLNDQDRLKFLLTGTAASEGTNFAKPFDVAVCRADIFAVCGQTRTIDDQYFCPLRLGLRRITFPEAAHLDRRPGTTGVEPLIHATVVIAAGQM